MDGETSVFYYQNNTVKSVTDETWILIHLSKFLSYVLAALKRYPHFTGRLVTLIAANYIFIILLIQFI